VREDARVRAQKLLGHIAQPVGRQHTLGQARDESWQLERPTRRNRRAVRAWALGEPNIEPQLGGVLLSDLVAEPSLSKGAAQEHERTRFVCAGIYPYAMPESGLMIWSVGHSNHSFENFAALLRAHAIECVVDVRSYPYSRFAPHFGREDLAAQLRPLGLKYLFLGEELGGRPASEDHYDDEGHALYGLMAAEPSFAAAIERVMRGARKYRVALMCSCGQPQDCHRRLLVGKVLADQGVELHHILPDGSLRLERTVSVPGSMEQPSLFGNQGAAWRSIQSVSHRQRLNTSSAA
jgi:hypothetical protein